MPLRAARGVSKRGRDAAGAGAAEGQATSATTGETTKKTGKSKGNTKGKGSHQRKAAAKKAYDESRAEE